MNLYHNTKKLSKRLYAVFVITTCYSIFVSTQILVSNDPAATSENILAKEFLFSSGIIFSVIASIVFIFFLILMYRVFRYIKESRLKIMMVLIISQIPLSFFVRGLGNTAVYILNTFSSASGSDKINELASLMSGVGVFSNMTEEVEWGMWLIPLAVLVYASGFIPRHYAILLMAGGAAWIIYLISFFFFPQSHDIISMITIPCGIIAEVWFTLWFLIRGVKIREGIESVNKG